jgi:predicted transcriptional regulator
MISSDTKKRVWYLHDVKKMSKTKIARDVGISRNSVIKILSDKSTKNEQFIKTVQKLERESNESLVEMLREDNRMPEIASKILNIMNDDEMLKNEIERYGLRPLATVFGIMSDKAIKAKELDMRSNRPEAFATTVNIVNDASHFEDEKEEEHAYTN